MKAKVSASFLPIRGIGKIGENPLPVFRALNHDKLTANNGTLSGEELEKFGYSAGMRVLPYLMQDRYGRERKKIYLKTIVLDNGILRAVFLPELGGRLHSLVDLRSGRELLFSNPVFQPGNLAIRNAWFSDGIEWNVSQFGHTFTTCSPMFFARLTDSEGNEFVRMYEYERQKQIFWQVDFHLPEGSDHLESYTRIVNDRDSSTPMYWWTNIACKEDPKTRVFASTKEVIYHDREAMFKWIREHGKPLNGESFRTSPNTFGHGVMPYLENKTGWKMKFDVSYPRNYHRSNEYFFQNKADAQDLWEAAAYEDGFVFVKKNTQPLRFSKVFCWGAHRGGRKWCNYLSEPGKGDYVELQSGLRPTQDHGMDMPANSMIEFSQCFGGLVVRDKERLYGDWDESRAYAAEAISQWLPQDEVLRAHARHMQYADTPVEEGALLHLGSGWGALERQRRAAAGDKQIPSCFIFPDSSLGREQAPWLYLLQHGTFEDIDEDQLPVSYEVTAEWQSLMEAALEREENVALLNCLAVCLYERGEHERACRMWEHSNILRENPLAWRNLGAARLQQEDEAGAEEALRRAYELEDGQIDQAFAEEYMQVLIKREKYREAWQLYERASDKVKASERVLILAGQAAIETGHTDFLETLFQRELAIVREGETIITDLWFKNEALKLAHARGVPYSEQLLQEVIDHMTPPGIIDLRMSSVI